MSKQKESIIANLLATGIFWVISVLCVPIVSGSGGIHTSALAASSIGPTEAQSSDSALDLRLVFYGYPKIGVPTSGAAIIGESGLSDVHDITFSLIGGELSPDGRLIAYDSCNNANRGLYLAEPDGSRPQMVTRVGGSHCADIRWAPDSKRFSYTNPADRYLHVFDIGNQRDSLIPNIQDADWHWWSPTGKEIVYGWRARGAPGGAVGRLLFITDLLGHRRQLTFTKDFVPCGGEYNLIDIWAPAWSPDGEAIAFTQCGRLFVISPAGSDLRQLTTPRRVPRPTPEMPVASAYSPRWSPDGRWILFIDDGAVLRRISPDGKTIVEIGKLPYWGGPFSIAPLNKR